MGRNQVLACAALSALAMTAACTRPGTGGRSVPLEVRVATADAHAEPFAAAVRTEAYARRFRPAKAGEMDRAVILTVRQIRQPVEVDGQPGFTYIVDWTRRGAELGGVEDDCVIGALAPCAYTAVAVLTRQIWGEGSR